jgi:hypothetical protein
MKIALIFRAVALSLAGTVLLAAASAHAADKRKAAPKPAPLAALSEEQLSSAERVLTGSASCDAKQAVQVSALPDNKGYFKLEFKGKSYVMAPEVTNTGAVRLEDKKNGLVWLQIPAKSMLMNAKLGQRMVDNCTLSGQST